MAEVTSEPLQPVAEENVPISSKPEPAQDTASLPATASEDAPTNGSTKRGREGVEEEDRKEDEASKRAKVEERLAEPKEEEMKEREGDEEEGKKLVKLGPREFESGKEMFDYFFKLLHSWPANVEINKYEHMVLLDLLKKGHTEPDKKIGKGIRSFLIRYHPLWKSRCFFLVRIDDSTDDFSFRKCVDQILPLPESLKLQSPSDAKKLFDNKKSEGHKNGGGGGGGRGGGGRGGHGRGRRGGFRK